jgi:hypothetical protein
VSREPAVGGVTDLGGSGAMDLVGTECRSAGAEFFKLSESSGS